MNMLYPSAIMLVISVIMFSPALQADTKEISCPEILDFSFNRLDDSKRENLCKTYQGKLLLIVNTASKCAFTPQYDDLEKLYRQNKEKGLVILGFPSNNFAGQEPGTEKQILDFCRLTYNVEFPMFEKTNVAKGSANPFYKKLAEISGEYPGWNFHKYLISPDGNLVGSYKSHVKPFDKRLVNAIGENLPKEF